MKTSENRMLRVLGKILLVVLCFGATALTPAMAAEQEDAKVVTVKADLKNIQAALARFRRDNELWPNRVDGAVAATNTVEVLYSAGNAIASPGNWPVGKPLVYKQMAGYFGGVNDRNYPADKWRGPYLAKETADPWGNTYLLGVKNLENSKPVWIISAGADGILQTPIDSPVCMDGKSLVPGTGLLAAGDDICFKYR